MIHSVSQRMTMLVCFFAVLLGIPSSAAVSLIQKMLAKNPRERISSSDVVKELAHINDQVG
jgi:hypothetical protein